MTTVDLGPCKFHPNKPGRDGYVNVGSRGEKAHRRAWFEAHGPIRGTGFCSGRCVSA